MVRSAVGKKHKPGCTLRDAGGRCASPDVAVAKKQALALLAAAERATARHPRCLVQLETARAQITSASGTGLELRNAYVRASYHAGQASACAAQAAAGPRQLTPHQAKVATNKTARETKAAARAAAKAAKALAKKVG